MKKSRSTNIFIDLETYSLKDIKECGSYIYAAHPSTEIICACIVYPDGTHKNYKGGDDREVADFIFAINNHISHGGRVVAHNAVFEYNIIKKYLPGIQITDFICTMHMSQFRGGLGSLKAASKFWRLSKEKWGEGTALIKEYHKLINEGGSLEAYFETDRFKDLQKYCYIDTDLTRELYYKIIKTRGHLTKEEYDYWVDTHHINELGIPVNIKKIKNMISVNEEFTEKIKKKFKSIYGMNPNSPKQIKEWLKDRGQAIEVFKRNKLTGKYEKKSTVEVWAVHKEWYNLTKEVREMFDFKWCTPSAQIKRLSRAIELENEDRVIGRLKHFGAITGRYKSSGLNILNFPSSGDKIFKETDTMKTYKWDTGKVLLGSLRSVIESEQMLIVSDLSQIEFRLLMWFCNRDDVLQKLNKGEDIYLDFAQDLFGYRPKKPSTERKIAKTGTLQLGYGSRPLKLVNMLSKDIKGVKFEIGNKSYNIYHKRYPQVMNLHRIINKFLDRGKEYKSSKFSLIDDYILLPSGRKFYVRDIDALVANEYSYYNGITPMRVPEHTAVSWLCQGTARDLISLKQHEAMKNGLKVIFNEYDKIVIETNKDRAEKDAKTLSEIMKKSVDFLPGLMLDSDTEIVKYYK